MKVRVVNLAAQTLATLNRLGSENRLGWGCDGGPVCASTDGGYSTEERGAIRELFTLRGPYDVPGLVLPDWG